MNAKNNSRKGEIYSFIRDYIDEYGVSPSISVIAENVGCSGNIVHKYLLRLEEEGLIRRYGHNQIVVHGGDGSVGVPILGSIQCGPLFEEFENCEGYLRVPSSLIGKGKYFVLRASGDSMTGAGIDDGDFVLVEQTADACDGKVVVALIGSEVTLKRLVHSGGRLVLHPENARYADIPIDGECKIQGVAIKVIKDIV